MQSVRFQIACPYGSIRLRWAIGDEAVHLRGGTALIVASQSMQMKPS